MHASGKNQGQSMIFCFVCVYIYICMHVYAYRLENVEEEEKK